MHGSLLAARLHCIPSMDGPIDLIDLQCSHFVILKGKLSLLVPSWGFGGDLDIRRRREV